MIYIFLFKKKDLETKKKIQSRKDGEEGKMLQNYVGNIEFDWRECIFVIVNKDCGGTHVARCATGGCCTTATALIG